MSQDVMDTIDQAKAFEDSGVKEKRERIIEAYCQAPDCGEPIPLARQQANTANDILYCVDCQGRLERTGRF